MKRMMYDTMVIVMLIVVIFGRTIIDANKLLTGGTQCVILIV